MSSKIISLRLPIDMIERIDEKCSEKGKCRNDYIKSVVERDLNTVQVTNVRVVEI